MADSMISIRLMESDFLWSQPKRAVILEDTVEPVKIARNLICGT